MPPLYYVSLPLLSVRSGYYLCSYKQHTTYDTLFSFAFTACLIIHVFSYMFPHFPLDFNRSFFLFLVSVVFSPKRFQRYHHFTSNRAYKKPIESSTPNPFASKNQTLLIHLPSFPSWDHQLATNPHDALMKNLP